MKDYLAGTIYTDEQKKAIMRMAKTLYHVFDIRRCNHGWNVCEDEDRERAVRMAINMFSDMAPLLKKTFKEGQTMAKNRILKTLKEII